MEEIRIMNFDISPYLQRLGLQHGIISRIEHEDAIVAIVYKIALASGVSYILKICKNPRHYYHEVYFLAHFTDIIRVPRIIQLIPPEDTISGAILMEYLPGELLSTHTITEQIAYELGVTLAKIHNQRTTEYGTIEQGNAHPSTLKKLGRTSKAQDYIAEKFEEAFAESEKHLPQEILEKSRQYYDTHLSQLNSVDGPCLTHRDFRPANIIVHDGKLHGIIDWSSSRAGFAEEDWIPLECGEWNISIQAKAAFLRGYATVRPVPDYQAILPFLQLVRAFFTIGYTIKSNTWQSSGARAYQNSLQIIIYAIQS